MAGIKTVMDFYCCAQGLGSAVLLENLELHKCLMEKLEELTTRPEQMWAGCVGAVAPCFLCTEVQTFFLFLGCLPSSKSVVA